MKKRLMIIGVVVAIACNFAACGQQEGLPDKPESIYDIVPGLKEAESFELGLGNSEIMNHICYFRVADGDESDALTALEQFDFTGFEKTEDEKWLNRRGGYSLGDELYFKLPDDGWYISDYSHVIEGSLIQTLWVKNENGEKTVYLRTIEEPPFNGFSHVLEDIDIFGDSLNTTAAVAYHPIDAEQGREIDRVSLLRAFKYLMRAVREGAYEGDIMPEYDIRLEIDNTDFIMGFLGDAPEGFVQGKAQYLIDSDSGVFQLTSDEGTEVYYLDDELFGVLTRTSEQGMQVFTEGKELFSGLYRILTGENE